MLKIKGTYRLTYITEPNPSPTILTITHLRINDYGKQHTLDNYI